MFDSERNWVDIKIASLNDNGEVIEVQNYTKVYFVALYFIVQTVTTVGYGDINPSNTKERVYVVLVMLIGVVSFSFIAGSLTSIIQDFDAIMSQTKVAKDKLMQMKNTYDFSDELYEKLDCIVQEKAGESEECSTESWLV